MSCFYPVSLEADYDCFADSDCAPRRSPGVFKFGQAALGGIEPTGVLHSEFYPDLANAESLLTVSTREYVFDSSSSWLVSSIMDGVSSKNL